jgi:hypothetical protein
MAKDDQINLQPHFKDEGPALPCKADAGDLYVLSPLEEGEPDFSTQGTTSLWFCIRGSNGEFKATWARVQFDGIVTCEVNDIPTPPQNHPTLRRG